MRQRHDNGPTESKSDLPKLRDTHSPEELVMLMQAEMELQQDQISDLTAKLQAAEFEIKRLTLTIKHSDIGKYEYHDPDLCSKDLIAQNSTLSSRNAELVEGIKEALTYFPDAVGRYEYAWQECLSDEQDAVKVERARLEELAHDGYKSVATKSETENAAAREVIRWAQATLTALNVGDVKSESPLHKKLREVMIAYRENTSD